MLGTGNPEILEKGVRHFGVVVLAGVHHDVLNLMPASQLALDGRELHEIRTGANDGNDQHVNPQAA